MMTIKTIEKILSNFQKQMDKQEQDLSKFQTALDDLQNQVDKLISERTVKKQKNIQPEP